MLCWLQPPLPHSSWISLLCLLQVKRCDEMARKMRFFHEQVCHQFVCCCLPVPALAIPAGLQSLGSSLLYSFDDKQVLLSLSRQGSLKLYPVQLSRLQLA